MTGSRNRITGKKSGLMIALDVRMLARMLEGTPTEALVVPLVASVPDNSLAETFRQHLTLAKVGRSELHTGTLTHALANFRTWRDSGLTWLAMSGLGVDKIMRRAGHDTVQTTMGYVKQAEDLGGELGSPFGPLPDSLVQGSGGVSVFRSTTLNDSGTLRRRARDSNPWNTCMLT